jgi:hypothetical protein
MRNHQIRSASRNLLMVDVLVWTLTGSCQSQVMLPRRQLTKKRTRWSLRPSFTLSAYRSAMTNSALPFGSMGQ